MPKLPADVRTRFNRVKVAVLQSEGKAGMHARFNTRSVANILADDSMPSLGAAIDSGQIDDVKYTLYDSDNKS
tara:strand:+ start:5166 stop:5384 length:219 start_codon:yes stop_codon:yes gene_type:complete